MEVDSVKVISMAIDNVHDIWGLPETWVLCHWGSNLLFYLWGDRRRLHQALQEEIQSREQGAGAGSREQGVGSSEQGVGSKEKGARSREQGARRREEGARRREQGEGRKEQGAGNKEQGAGSKEKEEGRREQEAGSRELSRHHKADTKKVSVGKAVDRDLRTNLNIQNRSMLAWKLNMDLSINELSCLKRV